MVRRIALGVPLLTFWLACLLALSTLVASRVDAGAVIPVSWAKLAAQVSGLTALTGAGSATDDILLISDTSASGAIKSITRSELASVVGSGWTTVVKTSSETRASNTTYTDDSALLFSMSANTKYVLRVILLGTSPSTPDFKAILAGPASPTIVAGKKEGSGATINQWIEFADYSTSDLDMSTNGPLACYWNGVLHNGANAGTCRVQWAQSTSDAGSTIVYAGSYIDYRALP